MGGEDKGRCGEEKKKKPKRKSEKENGKNG